MTLDSPDLGLCTRASTGWVGARVPGRPGMGIGPPGRGVLFKKISKSWDEVFSLLEFSLAKVRGKVSAPARVVPQKVFSPIGQVLETLARASLLPEGRVGLWLVET